ncbi:phosphate ABC transporter ATP-binding protein [Muricomes intestini]|jgi:phosphate transport system ATP-binding protein|uniref:phosphate ABC transporter ATP-binding protein n=1 Tax=Muricomes intestini TaxID=1796634 RepID=UPI000E90CA4E|nr:phosphate ABC transporter ATP-binding protein [Lachnospiraceae bacterium]HCR82106.1 phosphate ABC transporter ATP-binding protein [Lachnospiraceae bacterium]
MLEIQNLKAGFGKKEILHGINLAIPGHKITAIVGQSGCGKTTLLKSMNRILEEEGGYIEGSVLLKGADCKRMPKEMLRKKIGMVFQQPTVFPCSIEKNLSYVLKYHGLRDKSAIRQEIEACMKKAKLYDEVKNHMKTPAKNLSGGQKQRLAIARSLCAKPDVLVLDEPCSALDLKNTIAIEKTMLELKEQYTLVIVTHNLAQARRIADWVVFMDRGGVLEVTKKDMFFEHPSSELAREQLSYI